MLKPIHLDMYLRWVVQWCYKVLYFEGNNIIVLSGVVVLLEH